MVDDDRMRSPVRSFDDLEVFRRAYELSLIVHKASLGFPRIEQFGLADQMRRASKSICANIVEGFGKQRTSSAEFKRFLMMAIGSCDETQMWVRYSKTSDTSITRYFWRGQANTRKSRKCYGDCTRAGNEETVLVSDFWRF
jgi:four helix bundle protein